VDIQARGNAYHLSGLCRPLRAQVEWSAQLLNWRSGQYRAKTFVRGMPLLLHVYYCDWPRSQWILQKDHIFTLQYIRARYVKAAQESCVRVYTDHVFGVVCVLCSCRLRHPYLSNKIHSNSQGVNKFDCGQVCKERSRVVAFKRLLSIRLWARVGSRM
jgi:hypothetical protein